mgnify:CR=1 FL=1
MRIVVVGAGAVGGVVAANLAMAATPVVAVARGEHVEASRLVAHDYDLVALVGRAVRVGILERSRVGRIAADVFEELGRQDDVIGLRSVELQ